jgi:hypothetical protein
MHNIDFGIFFFNADDRGISGNYAMHAKMAVRDRVAEPDAKVLDGGWRVLSGDLFGPRNIHIVLTSLVGSPDPSRVDTALLRTFADGRIPNFVPYVIGMFMCPLEALALGNEARPSGAADRWALPIAGDDADAQAEVAKFMDAIGYDAVDCGTLAESWRLEPNTPVYALPSVGEPPAGMTQEERRRCFRQDRSARVTADQVGEFAAPAKKCDRVGGHFEDLPSGLMD